MAAIILNRHGTNVTFKISSILKATSISTTFKRHNYIVLLPEIPADTPETNSLLRTESLPDFSTITPLLCFNAVGKLLLTYELEVCKLGDTFADGNTEKSFEGIIHPLEKHSTPLNYAFGTMRLLGRVKSNEYFNATKNLQSRVQKSQSSVFRSLPVYHAIKEINADRDRLTECQKRVVDKYLLESRLGGMSLPGDQQIAYSGLASKLQKEKNNYRKKLETQMSLFKHPLSHHSLVKNFPDHVIKKMAVDKTKPTDGPWKLTLESDIYNSFLENCSDRMQRWNIWQAKVSLASEGSTNNSVAIEEIRGLRLQIANLLGFKTFAEMSMETKMAGNIENVKTMITTLHTKSKQAVEEELVALQKFAMDDGFDGALESWDIPYYRNQQRKHLFGLDDFEIRQYFPLPTVLKGLFKFCNKLFGITIEDQTSRVSTWHKDVKYYEIRNENGELKGSFYLDLYARPEKQSGAWIELGKTKNVIAKMEPLSYLVFNFHPLVASQPCLLSYHEVELIFQKFGHLLQHSLTTMPYSDVSGLNNLEWDVVNAVPATMKLFLNDYNTVKMITGHATTGEQLPLELHRKIINGSRHLFAYDLVQELYLSALDLELYSRKDFWMEIMKDVWGEFIPIPLDKKNSHPCSFREIFCDEFPASYFTRTWSNMIAADIFSAFHEAGLDNDEEVKLVGRRFRDTFLSLGGGCHPGEIFKRFRGRNPSLDALLITSGIKKSKKGEN